MAFRDAFAWLAQVIEPAVTNLVVAVVILLIGVVIAKIAERVIQWGLHELELNNWVRKAHVRFALEETIATAVKYVLYFFTIVITLNTINLTSFVFNVLAGLIIALVICAILLGVKDFVPNFFAGVSLKRRGFVKEGDVIRVRDIEGEVRDVTLLETRIKTVTGDVLFIPNMLLTNNEVLRFKRKKTLLK